MTETEKKGLTALAPFAGRPTLLLDSTSWFGRVANQLPRQTSSWSCRSLTLKTCPNGQRNSLSSLANLMWM